MSAPYFFPKVWFFYDNLEISYNFYNLSHVRPPIFLENDLKIWGGHDNGEYGIIITNNIS